MIIPEGGIVARLTWGTIGKRYFEVGVDRGVLYPQVGPGVPWNGLTGVSEAPSGGEPRPYYLDGYKYLNVSSDEEFSATIEAISAPFELSECDGSREFLPGLFVTQQTRKSFGMAYRTRVGNDDDGVDHAYKIHLVYNALASVSTRDNKSRSNSIDLMTLSWEISTLPPDIVGYRPSAHFVVDSRKTPALLMAQLEDLLYGSNSNDPYLPSVDEIMDLFANFIPAQSFTIFPDTLTGLYPISTTISIDTDLEISTVDGFYIIPVGSRLDATSTPGLYILGT
jgi:hypothetical protein